MLKRLMVGLATGALLAAMLPGMASAGGPKDMVSGSARAEGDDSHVTVHAKSDADGANARGTYRYVGDYPGHGPLSLVADVVCLDADGNEAVVGALVTASSNITLFPIGSGLLHYVEDNGPPGTLDASQTLGQRPAQQAELCEVFSYTWDPQDTETGNWVVKDRD